MTPSAMDETLFIIIKRKYFDQIKDGTKKEEFRKVTDYWTNRLKGKTYKYIIFQAGYSSTNPRLLVEYKGLLQRTIKHEFFGSEPVEVFAIQLGRILDKKNTI